MSAWRLSPSLLLVEDSDEDFEATARSLFKISPNLTIARCVDGDDALDYLYRRGAYLGRHGSPPPTLILLDLNLPASDGREVLAEIKGDARLARIPVVVLTTSANPRDIEACYSNGANSYLIKPVNMPAFTRMLQLLCDYWFSAVTLPEIAD